MASVAHNIRVMKKPWTSLSSTVQRAAEDAGYNANGRLGTTEIGPTNTPPKNNVGASR